MNVIHKNVSPNCNNVLKLYKHIRSAQVRVTAETPCKQETADQTCVLHDVIITEPQHNKGKVISGHIVKVSELSRITA
jgi:hypothetical protein